jgi:hypothetical protein
MTARSLAKDFGPIALIVIAALSAVVALAGIADARATVTTYTSLAVFHGCLEIAMLAYLAARGSRGLLQ